MKKILKMLLKMLPILLYPYLYMIIVSVSPVIADAVPESVSSYLNIYNPITAFVMTVIVHVLVILSHITFIANAVKGNYSSKDLALLTAICKLVHIPAFILHFLLGALGLFASIWGIGFIAWAIVIDILTILQTGIMSITTAVRCAKEKVFSTTYSAIFSVLGFIYCIDVVSSILVFIKTSEANKKGVPST